MTNTIATSANVTISGTDLAGNSYSGTDSITFTINQADNVPPTVILTDSDADNVVGLGDSITVTATFSEAMLATPTISITAGQATNVAMSASASSAIWTYNWTVSSTVSTEVSVTVSGTDLAGIAYSGTDSLTFRIKVLPDYLPTDGLVAWYPFNGNANDESGNGKDGTVLNGPQLSTDRNGTADSAYNFDWANVTGYGSDWQRINLDHDFNLGGTFSMNVWINPENHYWPNNNAKSAMILGGSSGCVQNGFRFSINTIDGVDGSIGASDGTSGFVGFDTNETVLLNSWQMVTLVVEGGNSAKMYKNGDLIASTTDANFNLSSCLTIGIHHQSNGKWYYFDGKIDDVGIWDRALSQAEVAQLYTSQIDTTSPTVTLTHNTSPTTTVSHGDTVTVTATFSKAMQATPTINITGAQATDVAMSATASSAIWTYNWTVSSTVATEVSVTVSGTDLAGIAYSGMDSLTFSIIVDNDPPTLVALEDSIDDITISPSQQISITASFSEPVTNTQIVIRDSQSTSQYAMIPYIDFDFNEHWRQNSSGVVEEPNNSGAGETYYFGLISGPSYHPQFNDLVFVDYGEGGDALRIFVETSEHVNQLTGMTKVGNLVGRITFTVQLSMNSLIQINTVLNQLGANLASIETQDEFDYLTTIFRSDANLTQSGPYIFSLYKILTVMRTEPAGGWEWKRLDILNGNIVGWSHRLYLVKYR